MKKGLYALSFGTFGLGIAEFVMMSILPDVAAGFHISLAEAGHLISAYALGVCFGAPLVVIVARNWPLRTILLALIGLFITGNVLMTVSSNYWMGLAARFISGLPHGAYFGVGSIVASRLAEKGKSTSAVATMVMGMTVANLFGVPVGNFLGQVLSWRLVFLAAALWGGVRTVDADCRNNVGQRWRLLLVQLHQSANDGGVRLPGWRHAVPDVTGRRQYVRRKLFGRTFV